MYEHLSHVIDGIDEEKDLKWWSDDNGVNMALELPVFKVSGRKSVSSVIVGFHPFDSDLCYMSCELHRIIS